MPKNSVYTKILREAVVVCFRFNDGREAWFLGPPLPPDYGKITAIEFSKRFQLPDHQALGVRANGIIEFLNLKDYEENG